MGLIITISLVYVNFFSSWNSTFFETIPLSKNLKNIGEIFPLSENTGKNRLESYRLITELDPIFSIPEQMSQIGEIEKSIENISRIEGYYMNRTGEKSNIFPLNFMKNYALLIRYQWDFLNLKTLESAEKYQNQLEKTALAYQSDAIEYKKSLFSKYQNQLEKKVSTTIWWHYITPALVGENMKLIEKNISNVILLIRERKYCLTDDTKYCNFRFFDEQKNDDPIIKKSRERHSSSVWLSIKNSCWSDDFETLSIEKVCPTYVNFCYANSNLENKAFYKTIEPSLRMPYEDSLFAKWAKITPSDMTTPYMCNDNRYKAILWNLDYYLAFLKEKNLQTNNETQEIGAEEKILLQNNWVNTDDIKKMISLYAQYLKKNIQKAQSPSYQEMLTRYRLLSGNLMNDYLFWNESLIHLMNYFIANKWHSSPSMASYLILARANHSFNYFVFSPFVWREKEYPQFLLKETSDGKQEPEKIPLNRPKILTITKEEAIKTYGKKNVEIWTRMFYVDFNKTDFYSKEYNLLWF